MSYSMARYRSPMGGMFDEISQHLRSELEKACPQSSAITSMRNTADDLEATWHPTGFYTWQQMADVVAAAVKVAGDASSAAIRFFSGNSTPDAKTMVRKASDKYNDIAKQALDYTEAWKAAKATGKPVEAPGFKRWVLEDLRAAADLMREIEIQVCGAPWWLSAVVGVAGAFVAVANVAKRAVGVVIKLGESTLKAVERTGDVVGFILSIAPYAALGVGAYLLYNYVKKRSA